MEDKKMLKLQDLKVINGGENEYIPQGDFLFTVKCEYSGNVYKDKTLNDIRRFMNLSAFYPDTPEGEASLLKALHSEGII